MEINGCMIRSTLCADNPEGFSTTVERNGVIKGPFATIEQAVRCAHAWSAESAETDTAIRESRANGLEH